MRGVEGDRHLGEKSAHLALNLGIVGILVFKINESELQSADTWTATRQILERTPVYAVRLADAAAHEHTVHGAPPLLLGHCDKHLQCAHICRASCTEQRVGFFLREGNPCETQREIVKRFPAAEKIVDHRLEMEPTALVERKIYGAHPTCAPGFTSADGEITVRVPSGLTALMIMPWLSIPIIFRGAKLATKHTSLPTSTEGSS